MEKSDCQDCQHLNRAHMWCRRHFRGIDDPEKGACEDFLHLLWELDYSKKKT